MTAVCILVPIFPRHDKSRLSSSLDYLGEKKSDWEKPMVIRPLRLV